MLNKKKSSDEDSSKAMDVDSLDPSLEQGDPKTATNPNEGTNLSPRSTVPSAITCGTVVGNLFNPDATDVVMGDEDGGVEIADVKDEDMSDTFDNEQGENGASAEEAPATKGPGVERTLSGEEVKDELERNPVQDGCGSSFVSSAEVANEGGVKTAKATMQTFPCFETQLVSFVKGLDDLIQNCEALETNHNVAIKKTMDHCARIIENLDSKPNKILEEDWANLQSDWKSLKATVDRGEFEDAGEEAVSLRSLAGEILSTVRPIDLDKILELLELNKNAGDVIEGKDIVLLLGKTGAGKTATLHYLAGSTFRKVSVDGFTHYEPQSEPEIAHYVSKAGCSSVTRAVQVAEVEACGFVTDVPGFDDTEGTEFDIANEWGTRQALSRASSIKPVVVIARDGMGSRQEGLSETLESLIALFGGELQYEPLSYVFTKVTDENENIHLQLKAMQRAFRKASAGNKELVPLLNDLVSKTADGVWSFVPTDSSKRSALLSHLGGCPTMALSSSFAPTMAKHSRQVLDLQLMLEAESAEATLNDHRFEEANFRVNRIKQLSCLLPSVDGHMAKLLEKIHKVNKSLRREVEDLVSKCADVPIDVYDEHLHTLQEACCAWCRFGQVLGARLHEDAGSFSTCVDTMLRDKLVAWQRELATIAAEKSVGQAEQATLTFQRAWKTASVFSVINQDVVVGDYLTSLSDCLRSLESALLPIAEGNFAPMPDRLSIERDVSFLESHFGAFEKCSAYELVQPSALRLTSLVSRLTECSLPPAYELAAKLPDGHAGTLEGICTVRMRLAVLESVPSVARLCDLRSQRSTKSILKEIDQELVAHAAVEIAAVDELHQKYAEDCGESTLHQLTEKICSTEEFLRGIRALPLAERLSLDTENQLAKLFAARASLAATLQSSADAACGAADGLREECEAVMASIKRDCGGVDLGEIADKYDKWQHALTSLANDTKGLFSKAASFLFGGNKYSSNSGEKGKCKKLQLATAALRDLIRTKATEICAAMCNTTEVNAFVLQEIGQLSWLVDLVLLDATRRTLATDVLDVNIKGTIAEALEHAAHILSHCAEVMEETDCTFSFLSCLLRSFQTNKAVWVKLYQSQLSTTHLNAWDKASKSLKALLAAAPDLRGLQRQVERRVFEIEKVCLVSFTDDNECASLNESEHDVLFRRIGAALMAAEDSHTVNEFVSIDTSQLYVKLMRHVKREIEAVGSQLTNLLKSFPFEAGNFRLIFLLHSILLSIERCCDEAPGGCNNLAGRRRDEAAIVFKNQLDAHCNGDGSVDDILRKILTLKEASLEIGCWHDEINTAIDATLHQAADVSPRVILQISTLLSECTGEQSTIAQMILSEHKCFEGAMNAVFNAATSRQGIDYALDGLGIPQGKCSKLKLLFENFSGLYKEWVLKGLSEDDLASSEIVAAVHAAVDNDALSYDLQVVEMSAGILAYWTLSKREASLLFSESENFDKLMQPHPVQVLSVLLLLNVGDKEYQKLRNCFIQVLTGEGKSIVLGTTSVLLALFGCQVDCICYSEYLSDRDNVAFRELFVEFGVSNEIFYGSVDAWCNQEYCQKGSVSALTAEYLKREAPKRRNPVSDKARRPRALLADEVDVLFKEAYFGKQERYLTFCPDEDGKISKLMQKVWANRNSLSEQALLTQRCCRDVIALFPKKLQDGVREKIATMLYHARSLESTHKYYVVDDKIAYKQMDGMTSNMFCGYYTAFAAQLENERGNISKKAAMRYLRMHWSSGEVSYSELPLAYDVILGVTGTLASYKKEQHFLADLYGVRTTFNMPSVYGRNSLKYAGDNSRDTLLCDGQSEHFMQIRREINDRRRSETGGANLKRAILVFFEDSDTLNDFYQSDYMKDLKAKTRVITETTRSSEKAAAFLQSTRAGSVSLLIREYGRGTDFKCFDQAMLDAGGVHVIQAFFTLDLAEELQIKGRTARQGAKGSFSMVLDTDKLQAMGFGVTADDVDFMRRTSQLHSFLDNKRSEYYEKKLSSCEEDIAKAEKDHYATLDYIDALHRGDRKAVLEYLVEQNRGDSQQGDSGRTTHTRSDLVAKRTKWYEKYVKEEKMRRRAARQTSLATTEAVIMTDDATHYTVLGLDENCTLQQIKRAFRARSIMFHPDTAGEDITDATAAFQRILEARDVLLDQQQRQAYDARLKREREAGDDESAEDTG